MISTLHPTVFKFSASLGDVMLHMRSTRPELSEEHYLIQGVHKHFSLELHYVYEGTEIINIGINRQELVLRPGDCCLIPRECFHECTIPTSALRLCFNMNMEYRISERDSNFKESRRLLHAYDAYREIRVFRDEMLQQLMNQYRALNNAPAELLNTLRGTIMLNIMIHALSLTYEESEESAVPTDSTQSITDISRKWIMEEYISEQFMYQDGIEGLAKALFLCERQTRALVYKTFGKNYKDLIIQQRMEFAHLLLRNPTLSLEQIAERVGYRSYSGFYLAYTRYYGISPENERKQLLQGCEGTPPEQL